MRSNFMRALLVLIILTLSLMTAGVALAENRLLQGTVLDESGKPVAGVELFVYDSSKTKRPADFISPKTGPDGKYSLTVPVGRYWVIARLRHGDKFGPLVPGDLHSGEPLEIDLAEPLPDVTFTVADIRDSARAKEKRRSDMVTLSGRILDEAGMPVLSSAVCVWRDPVTERFPDMVSAWTEADGVYTLYLPAGRYSLSAATAFPPPAGDRRLVPITLQDGQKMVALNLLGTNMKDSSNVLRDRATGDLPLAHE
jgi:hypothetical protein